MMRRASLVLLAVGAFTTPVAANVPVNDGSVLERRTEDSNTKVKIKLIQDQLGKYTKGVNCAVTTPKKADGVKNPTQQPTAGQGRATLDKGVPNLTASPAFTAPSGGASGGEWTSGNRAQLDGTGDVVGGVMAAQEGLKPNQQNFQTMAGRIGSDGTVMEALDANSALRTQTGLTFNGALQALSLFAQAYNITNIGTASLTSQTSRGVTVQFPTTGPTTTGGVCPAGTTGLGTAASPCVSIGCSTTPYGTTPAPGCVSQRYVDSTGNVTFMLTRIQTRAIAAQSSLSEEELMSSINQYQPQ